MPKKQGWKLVREKIERRTFQGAKYLTTLLCKNLRLKYVHYFAHSNMYKCLTGDHNTDLCASGTIQVFSTVVLMFFHFGNKSTLDP